MYNSDNMMYKYVASIAGEGINSETITNAIAAYFRHAAATLSLGLAQRIIFRRVAQAAAMPVSIDAAIHNYFDSIKMFVLVESINPSRHSSRRDGLSL